MKPQWRIRDWLWLVLVLSVWLSSWAFQRDRADHVQAQINNLDAFQDRLEQIVKRTRTELADFDMAGRHAEIQQMQNILVDVAHRVRDIEVDPRWPQIQGQTQDLVRRVNKLEEVEWDKEDD